MYADTRQVQQARSLHARMARRCKAVITSFEEAGHELFTFLQFPRVQWTALRTINALERINGEFRQRTKTQSSLPGENAVFLLLYGLTRSGQIVLRRIDGRSNTPKPQTLLKTA